VARNRCLSHSIGIGTKSGEFIADLYSLHFRLPLFSMDNTFKMLIKYDKVAIKNATAEEFVQILI